MRFPNEPFAPAPPVADPTEVGAKAAVAPARRVGDGTRGVAVQMAGPIPGEAGARQAYYEREENDRRKMCRRIYHIPVLLDTRSGEDRRKDTRRRDDTLTHIGKAV